jgi:hypothetical protein
VSENEIEESEYPPLAVPVEGLDINTIIRGHALTAAVALYAHRVPSPAELFKFCHMFESYLRGEIRP